MELSGNYLLFGTVSKAPFSACVSLMGVMAKLPWFSSFTIPSLPTKIALSIIGFLGILPAAN